MAEEDGQQKPPEKQARTWPNRVRSGLIFMSMMLAASLIADSIILADRGTLSVAALVDYTWPYLFLVGCPMWFLLGMFVSKFEMRKKRLGEE